MDLPGNSLVSQRTCESLPYRRLASIVLIVVLRKPLQALTIYKDAGLLPRAHTYFGMLIQVVVQ